MNWYTIICVFYLFSNWKFFFAESKQHFSNLRDRTREIWVLLDYQKKECLCDRTGEVWDHWITERQSVTLLSQDNAKQINQVYCMWFKNIHAVFVKLLNWLGVHKLQGPVQYLLMSTFMYGKNNTKQYMSTLITWDKQT